MNSEGVRDVSIDEAKRTPVPGTRFRGASGVRGVVVAGRSERGKALARLDCSIAGCAETHERESSDWHQCHRCRTHSSVRSSSKRVAAQRASPETTASAGAPSPVEINEDVLADEMSKLHRKPGDTSTFDCYAFADYRGDRRDSGGGVVLAVALGNGPVRLVSSVSSRKSLSAAFMRLLRLATASKVRVVFGQDHQYGIPLDLLHELELPSDWRAAMRRLFVTGPFAEMAGAGNAGAFAAEVNAWLVAEGGQPYFWSATKGTNYGIPSVAPRSKDHPSQRRLTEVAEGFPFCRIGDNGTVGGQSIVGIPRLLGLLEDCAREEISVSAWPFDALSVRDLGRGTHVAVEPYPSLVREAEIVQTDANDAIASATWAQRLDRAGDLQDALDLTKLDAVHHRRVRLEGWMAGVPIA